MVDPTDFTDRTVKRSFTDFDLSYGFDFNRRFLHSFTLSPVGIAVMGGVLLPTGSNSKKFADGGKAQVIMPDMSQMPQFAGRNLFTNPLTSKDFPLNMPIPMSMLGGPVQIPFPLSPDNVFNRFTDDGRLPAMLQPGTGGFGFLTGLFFTRQFLAGDWGPLEPAFGRSAAHLGATHQFVT